MNAFGAVEPLVSTVASAVFMLLGATAVYCMLKVQGAADPEASKRFIVVHRVAGWGFTLLFAGMFLYMIFRTASYDGEFSAREVVHFTLASALVGLLALKIAIPRRFPGLRGKLFFVGVTAYVLGSSLVLITAGYHLIKLATGSHYVWHSGFNTALMDERLGREFLVTKCSACHLLERILKPRSPAAWEATVNRMVALAQPRITAAQAAQVLGYLVTNHAPKAAPVAGTASPLEKHCLPCHEERDILIRHFSLDDWKVIIKAMHGYDAALVPLEQVDAIARYLVDKQIQEEHPRRR